MEQHFAGKVRYERAYAYYQYRRESPYTNIVLDIKYRNQPQLGRYFGELAARRVAPTGFFDDIDMILPVPLYVDKLAERGYNQSEMIAEGIRAATGIRIANNLVAEAPHATQTRRGVASRWANVKMLYAIRRSDELVGKHVLIVDDVVTTGATLVSCAKAVECIPDTRLSFFTLAMAELD